MSDMILDKRKKAHSATTRLLHLPLFQKCQQRNKQILFYFSRTQMLLLFH